MAKNEYNPPTDLADQVQNYASGLAAKASIFGAVTGNAPTELAPLVSQAQALAPLAKAVSDLELQLTAAKQTYAEKALPLWRDFSQRLHHAREDAKDGNNHALAEFLKAFGAHTGHPQTSAGSTSAPPPGPAPVPPGGTPGGGRVP